MCFIVSKFLSNQVNHQNYFRGWFQDFIKTDFRLTQSNAESHVKLDRIWLASTNRIRP